MVLGKVRQMCWLGSNGMANERLKNTFMIVSARLLAVVFCL